MPSIGEAVKKERRVTHLLWKAINSQLELEEATNKLMQDMYEDLENMRVSGCSSHDWTTVKDTEEDIEDIEDEIEENVEENTEEDIEEYIEVLMREMHPKLDQIMAAAGLKGDDLHDVFGVAKQMDKPQKFILGEKEEKATIEKEGSSDAEKKGKDKKQALRNALKH